MALPVTIGVRAYDRQRDVEGDRRPLPGRALRAALAAALAAAQLWVLGEDAVFLRLKWEVSGLDSQLVRLATTNAPHSPQFDW